MQYRKALLSFFLAVGCVALLASNTKAQTTSATFTFLPTTGKQIYIGETSETFLNLQIPTGVRVTGVDAQVTYDPTIIQAIPIGFPTNPLFTSNTISTPTPTGTVKWSSSLIQAGTFLTGPLSNPSYTQLSFKGLKAGQTTLRFACTQGATNDTNIVEYGTGNDIVTCASLPTFVVTVSAPTPTPSPTPIPTPTPTPTPTPPVIPVCLTIASDVAAPKYGDTVRFTCGQVAGATTYGFRYRVVETGASGTIAPISASSNISQPFVISNVGSYDVECRVCVGTTCSPYTAW